MGRTACTEPQCLYKGALYLLPAEVDADRRVPYKPAERLEWPFLSSDLCGVTRLLVVKPRNKILTLTYMTFA